MIRARWHRPGIVLTALVLIAAGCDEGPHPVYLRGRINGAPWEATPWQNVVINCIDRDRADSTAALVVNGVGAVGADLWFVQFHFPRSTGTHALAARSNAGFIVYRRVNGVNGGDSLVTFYATSVSPGAATVSYWHAVTGEIAGSFAFDGDAAATGDAVVVTDGAFSARCVPE